jgi:hypothetical protein
MMASLLLPYDSSFLPPCAQSRYQVPMAMGMFKVLDIALPHMSARNIIHRIVDKRKEFEARNAKKSVSEKTYYEEKKEYVAEL